VAWSWVSDVWCTTVRTDGLLRARGLGVKPLGLVRWELGQPGQPVGLRRGQAGSGVRVGQLTVLTPGLASLGEMSQDQSGVHETSDRRTCSAAPSGGRCGGIDAVVAERSTRQVAGPEVGKHEKKDLHSEGKEGCLFSQEIVLHAWVANFSLKLS
jgi:hypothetical protein